MDVSSESIFQLSGSGSIDTNGLHLNCLLKVDCLVNGMIHVEALFAEKDYLIVRRLTKAVRTIERASGVKPEAGEILLDEIDIRQVMQVVATGETLLIGYATQAWFIFDHSNTVTTLEAELSGFSREIIEPLVFKVMDTQFVITQRPVNPSTHDHSYAYHHLLVDTILKCELSTDRSLEENLQRLDTIAGLLAVANRGYVFVTAVHKLNPDGKRIESTYRQPTFHDKAASIALIPIPEIGRFVEQCCLPFENYYREWNLHAALDHYWRAMSTRTAWPIALSTFVAIESLVAAFAHIHTLDGQSRYYVARKRYETVFEPIIAILKEQFDEFVNLDTEATNFLKQKIRDLNTKPSTLREKLKFMLDTLGVDHNNDELSRFLEIRNYITHRGTPIALDNDDDDLTNLMNTSWEQARDALSLFEKILLRVLEYDGPKVLFNEGE